MHTYPQTKQANLYRVGLLLFVSRAKLDFHVELWATNVEDM